MLTEQSRGLWWLGECYLMSEEVLFTGDSCERCSASQSAAAAVISMTSVGDL